MVGVVIKMGNPKMMLFYIALRPSIIRPERLSVPMVLSLVGVVIMVLGLVFTICVLAAFALGGAAACSADGAL